ncbi:hypothetical protein MHYP_G00085600 [Metynnis hypsauchen]
MQTEAIWWEQEGSPYDNRDPCSPTFVGIVSNLGIMLESVIMHESLCTLVVQCIGAIVLSSLSQQKTSSLQCAEPHIGWGPNRLYAAQISEFLSVVSEAPAIVDLAKEQIEDVDLSILPPVEQVRVKSLLHKYAPMFSSFEGDIGCTGLITHDIPLLEDAPVMQCYRRIPPSDHDAVKAHIRQLLDSQVIWESCSPYASPIVLVKKKNCSLRMCVDYCQLNNKTRKDAFPLPHIEDTSDALSGAQWFTTMDLASEYNQIPFTEHDHPKAAFCIPFGLFEFKRMPFGLCNAPSTFQRLIERMFGEQNCQSLLLYLNDIIVFSSDIDQHVGCLELVLSQLQ